MKIAKKITKTLLALALTAGMTLSMTACSDTTWVYKYDTKTVSSGTFIAYTIMSTNTATYHEDVAEGATDIFAQTLDGKSAKQWIIDDAKRQCDEYIAIENKFEELGLQLTEKENNEINQAVKITWEQSGKFMESNGVNQKTYTRIIENSAKRRTVFNKYYGTGGLEEVSNDNLLSHFKDNFASINVMQMSIVQPVDGVISDEDKTANEETKKLANDYAKQFNDGKKTMGELADMYKHLSDASEHVDEDTEDVITKDADNKGYIKKDSTSPSEKMVKALFSEVKIDEKAKVISDDLAYYVVVRYDVTKDPNSFEDMKSSLLTDIKGEDFTKVIADLVSKQNPTTNSASIKRYDPKKIK